MELFQEYKAHWAAVPSSPAAVITWRQSFDRMSPAAKKSRNIGPHFRIGDQKTVGIPLSRAGRKAVSGSKPT